MKNCNNFNFNELTFDESKMINGGDNPLVEFVKRLFSDRKPNPHPCGGIGSQSRVQ